MILEKLNLCIAQIEYRMLNPTLEYKKLPEECGNWQVLQFNSFYRQKLPMRRKPCDTNICHLKNDNSFVVKLWYTAWWINFYHSFQIHWSNYYTIISSGCWNLSEIILSIHIWSDQVQGTMITLIWVPIYLHHWFRIQYQWSHNHYRFCDWFYA